MGPSVTITVDPDKRRTTIVLEGDVTVEMLVEEARKSLLRYPDVARYDFLSDLRTYGQTLGLSALRGVREVWTPPEALQRTTRSAVVSYDKGFADILRLHKEVSENVSFRLFTSMEEADAWLDEGFEADKSNLASDV